MAPTYVASYTSIWSDGNTPKTASVTTAVGDLLVLVATSSGQLTLNTPTGGTGLTWTLRQSVLVGGSTASVFVYTAPTTTAETVTLSMTASATTERWGFSTLRFSGALVGASAKTNGSGTPSLSLTPTAGNSAIVVINSDWNTINGASRTWLTATAGALSETVYYRDPTYTVYIGYHADAGAVAAKTVGLSAPGGQAYSIAAIELTASSATYQGAATLAGAATLTSGTSATAGAATLGATAALSAAAQSPAVSATLAAQATLTGGGVRVASVDAPLAAQATLAAPVQLALAAAGTLAATAALTAVPAPPTSLIALATLSPSGPVQTEAAAGALTASATLTPAGFSVLPVTATLTGAAVFTAPLFTAFVGEAALVGAAGLAAGPAVPFAAGALTATATFGVTGPLLITGGTGLVAAAAATLAAAATAYTPALVIPSGPIVVPVATPQYRLYAANTRTGRIGWELPFSTVSWNNPINDAGALRATLVIEDALDSLQTQGALDPRATLREVLGGPYRFSLVLAWGNSVVFAGPYLPSTIPGDASTVDVGAAELLRIFAKRLLLKPGWVYPSDAAADIYLGPTSPGALMRAIITSATTGPGRELPITCTNPPDPQGVVSAVYYGFDLNRALDALSALTAQGSSPNPALNPLTAPVGPNAFPDYRLDPYLTTKADGLYVAWELVIGNPFLNSSIVPWSFDDAVCVLAQDIDAHLMASTYITPGDGQNQQKLMGVASSAALIAQGFPALEEVDASYTSVIYQDRLTAYAAADLATYLNPVNKWSLKVLATDEPGLGTYRVGDPMLISVRRHPVIAPGRYPRRITEIAGDATAWVTVASTETISL